MKTGQWFEQSESDKYQKKLSLEFQFQASKACRRYISIYRLFIYCDGFVYDIQLQQRKVLDYNKSK